MAEWGGQCQGRGCKPAWCLYANTNESTQVFSFVFACRVKSKGGEGKDGEDGAMAWWAWTGGAQRCR